LFFFQPNKQSLKDTKPLANMYNSLGRKQKRPKTKDKYKQFKTKTLFVVFLAANHAPEIRKL